MAAFGFFLKKLITAFIMPLSLVLSLFLLSLILLFRKKEKLGLILASIALTLIFCFTTPWLVHLLLSPLEDSYKAFKSEKNISAIVVLGHGHSSNKDIPTHAQLSSSALFRLSEAWRIHKKSPSTKIILSGAAITDPIAHAEVLAIRKACNTLKTDRLVNCDIYVTLEPCAMCAALIANARIRRIYFAASD